MKKITFLLVFLGSIYSIFYFNKIKSIKIDHIYFINLDRSPRRLKSMKTQLDNLKIDYSRFPAIEGINVKYVNINTGETLTGLDIKNSERIPEGKFDIYCSDDKPADFHSIYLASTSQTGKYYKRYVNEIGTTCSHKRIWEIALQNNHNNVLILEDDAMFLDKFNKYFPLMLKNIPKDADYLYLNYNKPTKYTIKKNLYDRYFYPYWKKVNKDITSARAYIVNKDITSARAYTNLHL